jgi:hypothetical protein
MRVVTNNPRVLEGVTGAEFVAGSPAEVLGRVEVLLSEGYRLAGPLVAGNLVMLRSPFRSVLLEESRGGQTPAADFMKAADACRRAVERKDWVVPEETLEDYALMDSMFLGRAVEECGTALPGWK